MIPSETVAWVYYIDLPNPQHHPIQMQCRPSSVLEQVHESCDTTDTPTPRAYLYEAKIGINWFGIATTEQPQEHIMRDVQPLYTADALTKIK